MKFGIYIDQPKSVEWGLNLSEATLFSFCYNLPAWADHMAFNNEVYYFANRAKVVEEMPILTDKEDTVYRLFKILSKKGIIHWMKFQGRDYIKITVKGREWNNSEKNPSDGKKSSELGKFSENTRKIFRKHSENFPTDNTIIDNTIIDTTTIDKKEKNFLSAQQKDDFFSKKIESDVAETCAVNVQTLDNPITQLVSTRLEEYIEKLGADTQLLELIATRQQLSAVQAAQLAEGWGTEKITLEEFQYPRYQDFKRHFFNWLNLQKPADLQKRINGKSGNGNTRTGAVRTSSEEIADELAANFLARRNRFQRSQSGAVGD